MTDNIAKRLLEIANEIYQLSIDVAATKKDAAEDDREDIQELSDDLFEIQSRMRTGFFWLASEIWNYEDEGKNNS